MSNELKKLSTEPRLVSRVPVKKNRVVVAAVLIVVMGFLWMRVLLKNKKTPAPAGAGTGATQQAGNLQGSDEIRIEHIRLPVVSGRNDRLKTDMFSADNWPGCPWLKTTTPDKRTVKVVDNDRNSVLNEARRLASQITLEVIVNNRNRPEAILSIEGLATKVTTGIVLQLRGSGRIYQYEVTEILDNKVVVTWKGVKEILTDKQIEAWDQIDHEMTMFEQ